MKAACSSSTCLFDSGLVRSMLPISAPMRGDAGVTVMVSYGMGPPLLCVSRAVRHSLGASPRALDRDGPMGDVVAHEGAERFGRRDGHVGPHGLDLLEIGGVTGNPPGLCIQPLDDGAGRGGRDEQARPRAHVEA